MRIEELDWLNPYDVSGVKILLTQLTTPPDGIDEAFVRQPIACLRGIAFPTIFVTKSDISGEILGTISVIIEQKLIHNNGRVARIEDLVVDEAYRRIGIATHLISKAIEFARACNCYKVTLDCKPELERFYERHGFRHADSHMRMDLH